MCWKSSRTTSGSRVDMDGRGQGRQGGRDQEQKKDKIDKPAEKEKEIDIPEKAARAVKALKALYSLTRW